MKYEFCGNIVISFTIWTHCSASCLITSSLSFFLSFFLFFFFLFPFFSLRLLLCFFFSFFLLLFKPDSLFLSSKPTTTPHGETSSNLRSCTPFPTLEAPAPASKHLQLRRFISSAAPVRYKAQPLLVNTTSFLFIFTGSALHA
ncbi:hypothetical protein ACB094_04G026300 [Castanea mollissima]